MGRSLGGDGRVTVATFIGLVLVADWLVEVVLVLLLICNDFTGGGGITGTAVAPQVLTKLNTSQELCFFKGCFDKGKTLGQNIGRLVVVAGGSCAGAPSCSSDCVCL